VKIKIELERITTTLRGKLSLWYLLSVNLIIFIFLTSTFALFWITIQNQIDHHVHIVASEAAQIVQEFNKNDRDSLLKNLVSAKGMTIIVLSPDGAPILETNSPDIALVTEHQLLGILSSTLNNESSPTHFTESGIRFAAMPIQISSGKGILAVGYSTQVLYSTFIRMLVVVISVVIFLVFPITYLGYKFLKKELKPLEKIAHQAQNISSKDLLSTRITTSSTTQELTTIKDSLNKMFNRLEEVFSTERDFFADAAHTLKTPLAVLRSQIEANISRKKTKDELTATIDKANDTIQDLLFLAKVNSHTQKDKQFSLTDLITDLVELTTTMGENMGLVVSSDIQKNVFIKADRKLIQKALGNIVHNAVLYNISKGTIHFMLKKMSGKITIEIVDTGVGIKKSDQNRIFSRFFRGSNVNTEGSGLGLAISKAVVERYSGNIRISSSPNNGTRVAITLH
jgi:signal transduction histidine kinase